ncbi:unnamed protein product [Gongylonema pulchrum]|uniref:Arrestin_N domain-containing protein n=1 Tax=Gongylonema pulchrum TaxID=637853 RepID=A0A183CW91_9BILA|nr:unnamed protein product [Gongylonema pulchrum]
MPTVAVNTVLQETRILAGDDLYARILLDSSDPDMQVNEFFAEVEGTGRTGWVNIHTDKIYEREKTYLKAYIPLMAAGSIVPVGRRQFPIRIPIPEDAPSSYESEFGSIRYTIKVVLKTNSDQSTCTEIFPFAVTARSFFDNIPVNIMRNIEYKDEIDFTCCTLPFGTVSLKIHVPRTAFRLGEYKYDSHA